MQPGYGGFGNKGYDTSIPTAQAVSDNSFPAPPMGGYDGTGMAQGPAGMQGGQGMSIQTACCNCGSLSQVPLQQNGMVMYTCPFCHTVNQGPPLRGGYYSQNNNGPDCIPICIPCSIM
mmetsp:Transcript_897/g.1513  ORF Transcript_897/g.1513 Transcript_897/m.1513 type:complete len:118 (-) Transcript_897:83-436(-)